MHGGCLLAAQARMDPTGMLLRKPTASRQIPIRRGSILSHIRCQLNGGGVGHVSEGPALEGCSRWL